MTMPAEKPLSGAILTAAARARKIAILTGAGVSAESGVPTFRGKEGLWRNYRAEELATPEAFERDPALVWEWYDWRRSLVAKIEPNQGHYALAEMETLYGADNRTLITQNGDGLHRLAGSGDPLELHGNIWYSRCLAEGSVVENRTTPLPEIPPHCSRCGVMLRPHIVWFGESLDQTILTRAISASQKCDMFIVAGTSGVVQPAAGLAGRAKSGGALVIEINREPTPLSAVADVTLSGLSGEILPRLLEQLKELQR